MIELRSVVEKKHVSKYVRATVYTCQRNEKGKLTFVYFICRGFLRFKESQ